jgi:methionyl-tRNA formyltransferase
MTTNPGAAASAVVFAYHDIGVRCLEALIELGVDVRLVVTHEDNKSEKIWFASVREVAKKMV